MKFRYSVRLFVWLLRTLGQSLLKPIIPITIKFKKTALDYAVLLDSGADFNVFHSDIGEYLGLDISSGPKEYFGGIEETGGAVAYLHKIKLIIGGQELETLVGFSADIAKYGFGILGQKGFFDYQVGDIELKLK